jgi:hypothetical protein
VITFVSAVNALPESFSSSERPKSSFSGAARFACCVCSARA